MRLTEIKLSGFKSFVDPTSVKFPSNLIGIVGPNGCGKSNIIDAVRWVMGESSARQLRGESMTDVIFSGSSQRKPVGTATVELVFDNSDGRAGGEYASYAEISVKRQVSRDGQSSYFLNGSRCRRKDITNLFLGTGLGPRSYAVIEQGMISQVVEARPEELRGFIEEAAGISRYRERRKETENRIRHTRENLERLNDLREEVNKQLAKLKRQARAAERYGELKQRYREEEAKLLALRWREFSKQLAAQSATQRELENRLQAAVAEQRKAEAELEQLRQQQQGANEATSVIQAELYEVGAEIARLEQAIEHLRDIRRRQQVEHDDIEKQLAELQQHLTLDKGQVNDSTALIATLEPELATAEQAEQAELAHVEAAEADQVAWQQRWDGEQTQWAKISQHSELVRQRIEHLDQTMLQNATRRETLREQLESAPVHEQLEQEKQALTEALAVADQSLSSQREQEAALGEQLSEVSQSIDSRRDQLEAQRDQLSKDEAHLSSLQWLNAQSQDHEAVAEWLADQGVTARRVVDELEVTDAQWTPAVQAVLEFWLDGFSSPQLQLADQPQAETALTLVSPDGPTAEAGSLAAVTRGAGALASWLNPVRMAADRAAAEAMLEQLKPGQSVITPDGLWLGLGWVRFPATQQSQGGALEREQQIRKLVPHIDQLQAHIQTLAQALEALRQQREQLNTDLATLRSARAQAEQTRNAKAEQLARLDSRIEAAKSAHDEARNEAERLDQQRAEHSKQVGVARAELEVALEQLASSDQQRERLRAEQATLNEGLSSRRVQYRNARNAREAIAIKLESARAGLESLRQSIDRMDQQVGQLQGRYLELSEDLARGDAPVQQQQADRDVLLQKRLEIEQRLTEARKQVEALESQRRAADERRQQALSQCDDIREQQNQIKLATRETELRLEGLQARITELGAEVESVLSDLPEGDESQQVQTSLEALEGQIRSLEPVNLAAIDEYTTEAERKTYLDQQNADLEEALTTLEKAIEKIDRESRTRFKETFEQVNTRMGELFPRLFGGGHAHLEMIGSDWLNAGIAIMARPPGKRISRIHLMSGGEKALTAVSMVFAIFSLNPAPFCLLDEVDAPLDDANVGRFSDMVREMSEQVQFIVVTHNKVTMEVMTQMMGVTMREAGVSRLVSVDLDRAVSLVEANA